MTLYVDTSALAKWYMAESDSDAFDDFIRDQPGAHISRLTVLEREPRLRWQPRPPPLPSGR